MKRSRRRCESADQARMEEGGGVDRMAATAARAAAPDIKRSCHQAATLAAVEPSAVAA